MERPILFNDAMVRAILSGAKTQTRRPVRGLSSATRDDELDNVGDGVLLDMSTGREFRPPCAEGDRLWVRECWQIVTGRERGDLGAVVRYRADNEMQSVTMPSAKPMPLGLTWDRYRPSIHMPRWASRLMLRVTDVRVERVQDITEADAKSEGIGAHWVNGIGEPCPPPFGFRFSFKHAWDAAYPGSWERNDLVWVVTFERVIGGTP